ncbi:MAG: VanZ family protein [Blautia sp.]
MNRIVIALLKPFSFIPAILMMSMIFSFSSQNGTESSQLSEKVARGIFITIDHVMDRGWDDEKIQELADEYQYPVRKLAHMTEYCLLAICVSLPLYVYGLRGFALTFLAGILCVAFAASDEFHQTMVANRGPSVKGRRHRQHRRSLRHHVCTAVLLDCTRRKYEKKKAAQTALLLLKILDNRKIPVGKIISPETDFPNGDFFIFLKNSS